MSVMFIKKVIITSSKISDGKVIITKILRNGNLMITTDVANSLALYSQITHIITGKVCALFSRVIFPRKTANIRSYLITTIKTIDTLKLKTLYLNKIFVIFNEFQHKTYQPMLDYRQ